MTMFWKNKPFILYDTDGGGGGGNGTNGNGDGNGNGDDDNGNGGTTFEEWLADQSDEIKQLFNEHIHGLKSALDKERANSKQLKKLEAQLKQFQDADDEAKRKEMSDLEKAQTDLAEATKKHKELQKQLRDERIRHEVTLEAMKLNFHDPGDALNLVDLSDTEDDDITSTIKKQLKKIAESKAYLIKSDSKGDGIGSTRGKTKEQKSSADSKPKEKTGLKF